MMARNLDLTSLRSFMTVADAGGVTRAAAQLNLTQSAVSMQLKRLEEALGQPLLDRSQRTIALTAQGEQLLGYARRLIDVNDEAWGRMTSPAFEGEITVGVPQDIMYPHVPRILQRFAQEYPRVRVKLQSDYTAELKPRFARGALDLILTTEARLDRGGETLAREPLVWAGAAGGQAWRSRPLRFGSSTRCLFRRAAIEAMDRAGLPWVLAVDSVTCSTVEVSVTADLAVYVLLAGSVPAQCEEIRHGGALPELPVYCINMYVGEGPRALLGGKLATLVRNAYGCAARMAAE
jgi:DNA-binding transcriptional LysR family regulator